jgi:hypothetical protein
MSSSLNAFAATLNQIQAAAFQEFDREIVERSLYYHNYDHVRAVQHRANVIFQTIRPYLKVTDQPERLELLLDFCAATHDVIQIFLPITSLHASRRRESGVSEAATLDLLLQLIYQTNASLTKSDLSIIRESIEATVCTYDPQENSIFQPTLYHSADPISLVARILALADIGSLGIEGITSYNAEGSLLFLEENPDVLILIEQQEIKYLSSKAPELYENIRQRLLKRTQFQVDLAKSRFKRFSQEILSFPPECLSDLRTHVFQHLTEATVTEIIQTTPTAADTPLETLLDFFQFDQRFPHNVNPHNINLAAAP